MTLPKKPCSRDLNRHFTYRKTLVAYELMKKSPAWIQIGNVD